MATRTAEPSGFSLPPEKIPFPKTKWGPAHYLAILGFPVFVWFIWTLVSWLAAGPFQYTESRDGWDNANWWAARVWEGVVIINAFFIIGYLIRGCREQNRFFTFDVLFCICGATGVWADLNVNFIAPGVLISSNWVNLNSMCGYTPGVVNPDCSRAPDPILFFGLLFTFGLLTLAIMLGKYMDWLRARKPHWSKAKLALALFVTIMVIDGVFEMAIVPFGLWTYPPGPLSFPVGNGYHFETFEWAAGACFLGVPAFIRIFKDDRGRTIVEQGIDYMPYALQKITTFLSMFLLFQIGFFILGAGPAWIYHQFQDPYEKVPAYVANDICDIPGVSENTRYGPCPGADGWRMPGRSSDLPGSNP